MKFGVWCELFQDAPTLVEMAVEAEQAGWDGFFIWDKVVFSIEETFPIADPWVVLGAIAANTKRIRIGTMVTPLPRRRPCVVARETVSVDRLSNSRLTSGSAWAKGPTWRTLAKRLTLRSVRRNSMKDSNCSRNCGRASVSTTAASITARRA